MNPSAGPAQQQGTKMSLPTFPPQMSESLDVQVDQPLDTPFLNPAGAISRPSSFSHNTAAPSCKTAKPLKPLAHAPLNSRDTGSFPAMDCTLPANTASRGDRMSLDLPVNAPINTSTTNNSIRRVTWLDYGLESSPPSLQDRFSTAQHSTVLQGGLVSMHSAPPAQHGATGDLRDQGRLSSAGGMRFSSSGLNPVLGSALDLVEDVRTPMQACTMSSDCISTLLGSLGTSLFCEGQSPAPPARTAAAAKAAAPAKQAPRLPDFVEAWEGPISSTMKMSAAAAAAAGDADSACDAFTGAQDRPRSSSCSISSNRRRSSSSNAGCSAFATADAAAAAGFDGPLRSSDCAPGFGSAWGCPQPQHKPLAHTYSTPARGFPASFPNGSAGGVCVQAQQQQPVAQKAQAAATAARRTDSNSGSFTGQGFGQGQAGFSTLRRSSSAGGSAMPGAHGLLAESYSSTGFLPGTLSGNMHGLMHPAASAVMMQPLQGIMPSAALLGQAYSNPVLTAMLQGYYQNSLCNAAAATAAAAAGSASVCEAWALAYLSSLGSGLTADLASNNQGSPIANSSSSEQSSWSSQPGIHFPPSELQPGQWHQCMDSPAGGKFGGRKAPGVVANSKVDPKSLCGVDPRLCVGSPGDIELEVCRRNPGLAELLRLPPRSVKLNNIPVLQDSCPPEQLASKRPDGPITPEELTIESGLLRHCFGLPSSIGPDLVRAARHAVTRGEAPGSGLEPFFWVLQAKLNWLLKRPVFFKGQLLRGEIHAITDHQRAQSFAQVTEQRSKLGELLLVLFRMLQA